MCSGLGLGHGMSLGLGVGCFCCSILELGHGPVFSSWMCCCCSLFFVFESWSASSLFHFPPSVVIFLLLSLASLVLPQCCFRSQFFVGVFLVLLVHTAIMCVFLPRLASLPALPLFAFCRAVISSSIVVVLDRVGFSLGTMLLSSSSG